MSKDVRLWEEDKESILGLKPKFKMLCSICKPPFWMFWAKRQKLEIKMGYTFAFSLRSPEERKKMKLSEKDDRDAFAMDVWSVCPRCHLTHVNGVPQNKIEHWKKFDLVEETARREGHVKEDERAL